MRKFTGQEYLYIDIANYKGFDKETWDFRINWTKENLKDLEVFVNKADDSIMYEKAVHTLRQVEAGEPVGYLMGMDATASGYQLMSALHGCKTSAAQCNLIDTGSREDLYQNITDEMVAIHNVSVIRKDVKKPCMTVGYGSKKAPELLFGKGTPELEAFYNAMYTRLPGCMSLMADMQSCMDPDATSYSWRLPDGHVAVNTIMVAEDKRVEIEELGGSKFTYRMYVNGNNPKDKSMASCINYCATYQ